MTFKLYAMAVEVEPFFFQQKTKRIHFATMLSSSNQMLSIVWTYRFYDMTLSTE